MQFGVTLGCTWVRVGSDLWAMRHGSEVYVGSMWGQCRVDVGSVWGQRRWMWGRVSVDVRRLWGDAGSLHGRLRVDVGSTWGQSGVDPGSIWRRSGADLACTWWWCGGRSEVDLGSLWGRCAGSIWGVALEGRPFQSPDPQAQTTTDAHLVRLAESAARVAARVADPHTQQAIGFILELLVVLMRRTQASQARDVGLAGGGV